MTPETVAAIRSTLGLGRRDFARLIGYTGSDSNNWWTIARMESGKRPISPASARLISMIYLYWKTMGKLPDWEDMAQIAESDLAKEIADVG